MAIHKSQNGQVPRFIDFLSEKVHTFSQENKFEFGIFLQILVNILEKINIKQNHNLL